MSKRAKITFLSHNVSGNCMFRTALLYRALEPHFDVEIIGFDRGGGIWGPLRNEGLNIRHEPYGGWPVFLRSCWSILKSLRADVVIASKPRLPSFGLGLLNRLLHGTPVIVDNEDDELSMTRPPTHIRLPRKIAFHLSNPDAHLPTQLLHRLVRRADQVFVVSTHFQRIHGGTVVPHGLPPLSVPGEDEISRLRSELGIGDAFIVVFVGMPRAHKGIVETLDAAAASNIPGIRVVVVGVSPNDAYTNDLSERYGDLLLRVPPVPSAQVPSYLALGNVTVLAQQASEESMGQMPAKLTDAMLSGIPIIATRVSDIPLYLDGCGIVLDKANPEAIAIALRWVHAHPEDARTLGKLGQARANELLTDKAIARIMLPLVNQTLDRRQGSH